MNGGGGRWWVEEEDGERRRLMTVSIGVLVFHLVHFFLFLCMFVIIPVLTPLHSCISVAVPVCHLLVAVYFCILQLLPGSTSRWLYGVTRLAAAWR